MAPVLPLIIAVCACLGRAPAYAQEVSSSTAQSPLFLTISKDSYSSRVGLDYRIRWDFSDLASFRPGLRTVYSGIKAAANWDITENTRLEYYGFRTNPWRLIVSREKVGRAAAGGEAAAPAGGIVRRDTPEYRKRLRLSVSPLVDDIKRNLDDGLRDFLLRSSLKGASPQWEKAGAEGRRAFIKDVLSIGIWDSGVPLLGETGKGLEYLGEEGRRKKNGQ